MGLTCLCRKVPLHVCTALKENAEMPYNLPPLTRTFVTQSEGWTILYDRRNGENFFISTFHEKLDHATAFRRHTAAVRRYRWLQRIWHVGKHFEWSRAK